MSENVTILNTPVQQPSQPQQAQATATFANTNVGSEKSTNSTTTATASADSSNAIVGQPGLGDVFLNPYHPALVDCKLAVNKSDLLEYLRSIAKEAIRVGAEQIAPNVLYSYSKDVSTEEGVRLLNTFYYPSAPGAGVNSIKSIATITLNADILKTSKSVTNIFEINSIPDVDKAVNFVNADKMFYSNTVVPIPYKYDKENNTLTYYVSTLVLILSVFGYTYDGIRTHNKKVSIQEYEDRYIIYLH